jgi:DNA-binding LacI/PurR family transcriptional regulator
MMDYAEKSGYLVCISGDLHIERIGGMMMDGLILPTEAYARPEYLRYLRKYRMPYVVIGYGEYIPKNVYSVTVDTGLAARELVGYLRERGHRRIAFVNGNDSRVEGPRISAFRSLMGETYQNRLDDYTLNTAALSGEVRSDDFYRIGRTAAEQFARRKLDATAVICFNDDVAVGFYRRIIQLGYRIPQDVSVTGFDGLALGEYMNPALTSMSLNPFNHGKKCAEVILNILRGEKPGYKHSIDFSLIERESVSISI